MILWNPGKGPGALNQELSVPRLDPYPNELANS